MTGCLLGIQALVRFMTEGGSIVNISSRAGVSGYHAVAYGTSKWAVRGLSRTASMELGGLGIRVNCVLPGYIDTPMSSSAPDWFRESSLEEIPLARLGTVDDITPLMVFLMADESSYISGSEFNVDGGEYGHAGVKRYSDLARRGGLDRSGDAAPSAALTRPGSRRGPRRRSPRARPPARRRPGSPRRRRSPGPCARRSAASSRAPTAAAS